MRNGSFINSSHDKKQSTESNTNILQLKNGGDKFNNDSSFIYDDNN